MRSVFASAVKKRRHQLGLTQEELAWRAGLHRTYITDIERGARNVSLQSIEKLARALEATIAELFKAPEAESPGDAGLLSGAAPGEGVDILLVEDNPDDVELTMLAFKAARLKNLVHHVKDGAEAMAFLFRQGAHAKTWDSRRSLVVLLDLNLPKLSGLEVLRRLRDDARTAALPVVVLTASAKNQDVDECRQLGCNYYIVKPVGFENFSKVTPHLSFDWRLVRRMKPGGQSSVASRTDLAGP